MINLKLNKLVKLNTVIIMGLTALGMGACSTTSGTRLNGAAPITYKTGQGSFQQASLTGSYSSALPSAPRSQKVPFVQMPRTVTSTQPLAQGQPKVSKPSLSEFNMKKIDTDLYAHQKVGNPYTIMGKRYTPKHQPKYDKIGTASWYGSKFHGKLTANGETYDMNGITAAHKTLPLNSMVMVTNLESGKYMKVRINDRGPFVGDRIIDLSRAVADQLGLFESGLGKVRVQYAGPANPNATNAKPATLPEDFHGPRLKPAPAPKIVTEASKYRPLRDLGTPPATPVAEPLQRVQPRFPFEPQMNLPQQTIPQAVIPQPSIPQQATMQPQQVPFGQNIEVPAVPSGNIEDGPITLTIKGPIHMASDKNGGTYIMSRFIPSVNYKNLSVEK